MPHRRSGRRGEVFQRRPRPPGQAAGRRGRGLLGLLPAGGPGHRAGFGQQQFFDPPGYISPSFHTPTINVVLSGVVGLIALKLNVATSTSFINFGAFSAFTFVNLCVIAMFIRRRREHTPSQRVVPYVVFPAIGAVVDVYLLLHLDGKAKLLGVTWLTCGVLYLTYLTRGFRRPRHRWNSSRSEVR